MGRSAVFLQKRKARGSRCLEVELFRRFKQGDPSASEQLFIVYLQSSRPIEALLRNTLPNPADREEMLHEIYLKLHGGNLDFRGEAALSTFVYAVARLTIFQKFRVQNTLKRGRIYRTISGEVELPAGSKSDPEYCYSQKQGRRILQRMIGRLPAGYREVLHLHVFEDLSYRQIAERLNQPVNTISSKIHKGKKILFANLPAQKHASFCPHC